MENWSENSDATYPFVNPTNGDASAQGYEQGRVRARIPPNMSEQPVVDNPNILAAEPRHAAAVEPTRTTLRGPMGPVGPTGPRGYTGPEGEVGLQGPTGPAGPMGPQGLKGPAGQRGERGIQGIIGPTGPAGPRGPSGMRGSSGPAGPKGDTGPEGPRGPRGLRGESGAGAALPVAYGLKYHVSPSVDYYEAVTGPVIPLRTSGLMDNMGGADQDALTVASDGVYEISYHVHVQEAEQAAAMAVKVTRNGKMFLNDNPTKQIVGLTDSQGLPIPASFSGHLVEWLFNGDKIQLEHDAPCVVWLQQGRGAAMFARRLDGAREHIAAGKLESSTGEEE
ncbi:hypothetical protein AGMMS49992_10640 [Clostridia bacterium]|nr:hypothetical protein AGMMS49992_10640 [Clostridia bacterium]